MYVRALAGFENVLGPDATRGGPVRGARFTTRSVVKSTLVDPVVREGSPGQKPTSSHQACDLDDGH
jgi:hypothetical protein